METALLGRCNKATIMNDNDDRKRKGPPFLKSRILCSWVKSTVNTTTMPLLKVKELPSNAVLLTTIFSR